MNIDVAFHIPEWVLWLIGIPVGLVVGFLALVGWQFIDAFKDGLY